MLKSVRKYKFGDKFRMVRERHGLTLKEIALRAGVSESMVSQIERNKVSPSVETLIAIADALEIDLEYVFHKSDQDSDVALIDEKSRQGMVIQEVTYYRLSKFTRTHPPPPFEVLLLEIPVGKEKGRIEFGHGGIENGFIIEGTGEFTYGTKLHVVRKGDSLSFQSDIPHILRNTGDVILRAIWTVSPPRFFGNNSTVGGRYG